MNYWFLGDAKKGGRGSFIYIEALGQEEFNISTVPLMRVGKPQNPPPGAFFSRRTQLRLFLLRNR